MKMEFLDATGNGEYPNASPKSLVRLSEFGDEELSDLIESIEKFLSSTDDLLELHKLSFIHPINCSVTFKRSKQDEGLVTEDKENEFLCCLSPSGYKQMLEIMKHTKDGHNWLTPGEYCDEPSFLLSRYGTW